MKPVIAVFALSGALGLASAALAAGASSPEILAPCARLAARAHALQAKGADWSKGSDALSPALEFAKSEAADLESDHPAPPGSVLAIAQLKLVRDALADTGSTSAGVEHLAGTDLYEFTVLGGTLHCATNVFVRAPKGSKARLAKDPSPPSDDTELCWTRSGDLASVLGRPAYVEHGPVSAVILDEDVNVTPWTGSGWGRACRLELRFLTDYQVSERYCGDQAVCDEAERVARDVAIAYNRRRQTSAEPGFLYGPPAPEDVKAKVKAALSDRTDTDSPDFPTFGTKNTDHPMSYSGLEYFPLKLGATWRMAAIGREGVGWREGDNTLLIIYDAEDSKPFASFVLPVKVTGLASARAVLPKRPKKAG
jgi:hypothetical protein